MTATTTSVVGLVLAAGEGSRLGQPKALVVTGGVTWLERAVAALRDGGVDSVVVVAGAALNEVEQMVPAGVELVVADGWAEGMGASLRTGLGAIASGSAGRQPADAVMIVLVDTPGVGAEVVRRLAAHAEPGGLARATYGGIPGHPVLIGRDHWLGVVETARGDSAGREYLRLHDVTFVPCDDIGSGEDIDTPDALRATVEREQAEVDTPTQSDTA